VIPPTHYISGPPRVGKTLTGELLAEHLQKALMPVSAGELGTTAEAVEQRLPRIFKRPSRWKAALLVDEVDVLLEQRSVQDIHRNTLVVGKGVLVEGKDGGEWAGRGRLVNMVRRWEKRDLEVKE
jgi:AAA+ superfamily predicted ATPase